jgi:hypoxanthine-DNA glycosylase
VTPPLPAEKKSRKASAKKAAVVTVASVAAAAAAATTTTSSSPFPSVTVAAFSSVPSTNTPRTESFPALVDPRVPVHTLILGTHPSVKSLEEQEYYGHAMNAFWWIAGDCLGFRRAAGLNVSGEPFKFTSHVRYGTNDIIPYDAQVQQLVSKGFALWDVVKSCHRKGSLDSDIEQEEPNDIQGLVSQYPSIKRIVFANGGKACEIFNKHFKEWWEFSNELQPNHDDFSQRAFGKKYARAMKKKKNRSSNAESSREQNPITCICAISVSPAAARYSYTEKRDFWEQHVYAPGLQEYEQNLRSNLVPPP